MNEAQDQDEQPPKPSSEHKRRGYGKQLRAALVPPSAIAAVLGVLSALDQLVQHAVGSNGWRSTEFAIAGILLIALIAVVAQGLRRRREEGRPLKVKYLLLLLLVIAASAGSGFAAGSFLPGPDGGPSVGAAPQSGRTAAPDRPSPSPLSTPSTAGTQSSPPPLPPPAPTATVSTSGPTSPVTPTPTPGRASIAATGDHPEGCNTFYAVSGATNGDPVTAGKSLWVVAELLADEANGKKNHFYAKAPVGPSFEGLGISANTEPGSRTGRYLLVAADGGADADLRADYESDRDGTGSYPDSRREALPAGGVAAAGTPLIEQHC
jgi:hypothetical protein